MLLKSFSINIKGIMEAVSRMEWIIIYNLRLFHLQPPLIYRPVQAGAGEDGPILRL